MLSLYIPLLTSTSRGPGLRSQSLCFYHERLRKVTIAKDGQARVRHEVRSATKWEGR
jgi:hypothetical protein